MTINIDALLISTPNKNIDYPGLSLPILSAALRQENYLVEQLDLNMTLRDKLITQKGLSCIIQSTIPSIAILLSSREAHLAVINKIYDYFRFLHDNYGFDFLEKVKIRAQDRNFKWIFEKEKRFTAFLHLFKINRALHYIIDIIVAYLDMLPLDYASNIFVEEIENISNIIKIKKPSFVGFSILDIQRRFSLKLVEKIRKDFSGIIAVGGPDPTRFEKEYIEYCRNVDVIFARESEISLPMFIGEYKKNGTNSFSKIPGILYRKNGAIIKNQNAPVDLSEVPTPDFDGLPLNLYLTPTLPIQSSRGCYWQKCRFCIHWDTYCDVMTKNNTELKTHFRYRAPQKVIKDIKFLTKKYNAKYFHFTDDCIPIFQAKELIEEITKNSLDIRWLAYFRFEDEMNIDLLNDIKNAGGRVLEMGLESGSDYVLELMNKNISIKTAKRVVSDASGIGLMIKLFMFHGFPGERLNDLKKTIRFTKTQILNKHVRPFLPLRNRFELLGGSDIFKNIEHESTVLKYWKPSGLFGIRAEYLLKKNEIPVQKLVSKFVQEIRDYMSINKIYNTDDDNVMLDLIVMDFSPTKAGWRCM